MQSDETPDIDTDLTENVVNNSEQSITSLPEDVQLQKEKIAFEAYVKNQGGKIPENFKDAGSWFDSLKNAQREYTKSRQEVAALKTKYEQGGANNPDYKEPSVTPVVKEDPVPSIPEVLRIPDKPKVEEQPKVDLVVNPDDWKSWTVEYATNGTLSDETKTIIKEKTKLPDYVIEEYMSGQKAKIEVAYTKAADVIGGKENLNKLFVWASKNLSETEQASMNSSLASSNWEIALLGLHAMYQKKNPNNKLKEPVVESVSKKVSVSATQSPDMPYRTKREFSMERNNPAFGSDPKYRRYVETRMMKTDFNKLPS